MKRYKRLIKRLIILSIFLIIINSTFSKEKLVKNPDDILVLVNYENPISTQYKPSDLVVPNIPFSFKEDDPKKQMRQIASKAIEEMFEEASKGGVKLYGVSGYRSSERQKQIFDNRVEAVGINKAKEYVALPGESEHQTGLAMDIGNLEANFGESKEGKWLRDNAHNFGFIIRYPKGKEHITRINYEPWHFRYVGVESASTIYSKELTLEEYLQNKTKEESYIFINKDIGAKVLNGLSKILKKIRTVDILNIIKDSIANI